MSHQRIAIIDYGSGNLRSAQKAFAHVLAETGEGGEAFITDKAEEVAKADRIVLPGQGAFGDCIDGLKKVDGMVDAMEDSVLRRGVPFFGICVGMQLLATRGLEFGEHQGLGWIAGDVRKIETATPDLKIPHMGWNGLSVNDNAPHSVLQGITKNPDGALRDFYFVHSFVFDCKDTDHVAAWCEYGEKFTAIVARDNMIGCQFHPEKSQNAGLELIREFIRWKP